MKKIILSLFCITLSSFAQETYRPYFEGYKEKRPYHNRTPYAFKTHTKIIENTNESAYFIDVAGTLNPLNEELIIENIGDTDIINPKITINDKWNWNDIESMTNEIIRNEKTDED